VNRRVLAVIALVSGALLAVAGSLQDLYVFEQPSVPRGVPDRFVLTFWAIVYESDGERLEGLGNGPEWGYGMVAGVVLALLGAVLVFRSPRAAVVGRIAAVAGFGVMAGTTWSACTTVASFFPEESSTGLEIGDSSFGPGLPSVLVACALVLAGALLAQEWPERAERPAGPSVYRVDGDDDDTPPFGIPIPVHEIEVIPERTGESDPPTGGNPSTVER
jgi:hypothetical protein